MLPISVVILAKDEQENLRQLLPSLSWAEDLLVVVDARSQDATAEVAQAYGARVILRPLTNYAAQRNAALALAKTDWIFWLDADERPTAGLVEELHRRLPRAQANGFRVPIHSWIFGRRFRWSGLQEDRPVRIARRGYGWWEGAVHERLCVPRPVQQLQQPLLHQSTPNLHTYLVKMHCYARLEAQGRVQMAQPPSRWESWLAPLREIFRRFWWKWGLLDGPAGWAFCGLSGLNAWLVARQHRLLWNHQTQPAPSPLPGAPPGQIPPTFQNCSFIPSKDG